MYILIHPCMLPPKHLVLNNNFSLFTKSKVAHEDLKLIQQILLETEVSVLKI